MSMQDEYVNDLYNRLSVIVKNDRKYSYSEMGEMIIKNTHAAPGIEYYFQTYPPLIDIAELGASIAYEGTRHHDDIVKQIKYKLQELKSSLPDIR